MLFAASCPRRRVSTCTSRPCRSLFPSYLLRIMAMLDSEVELKQRVGDIGLGEFWPKFQAAGLNTFGNLAFASAYVPGSGDETSFENDVILPILGDKKHIRRPALRRLFYEAFTLCSNDMSRRTEQKSDDSIVRMPPAEREHRRAQLVERLRGLDLNGDLGPSHKLLDQAYELYDKNVVRYIDWWDCTTRGAELAGQKVDKVWRPDHTGTIKEVTVTDHGKARLDSDLRLRNALTRRGLALDMAGVCEFEVHSMWVEALLAEYTRDPLPGYSTVSTEQLRRADQLLWAEIARECRGGVRGSDRPVGRALKHLMDDPRIRLSLMPLPAGSGAASSSAGQKRDAETIAEPGRSKRTRSRKNPKASAPAPAPVAQPAAPAAPGGGARQKGAGKGFRQMPAELQGKTTRHNGQPICWSYNTRAGCDLAMRNCRCRYGLHVCAEQGCQQLHRLVDHR